MPIELGARLYGHGDAVFVSDIIHGSKTSTGTIFTDITSQLMGKPVQDSDASAYNRGDYWTDGSGNYLVVIGELTKRWDLPFNDTVTSSGAITPAQFEALRSAEVWSLAHVYHTDNTVGKPNVTNVTALANRAATFSVDGGWSHQSSEQTTVQSTVLIFAKGAGDTNATGEAFPPVEFLRGATGRDGPKGDKGDPSTVAGPPGQGVPTGGTANQVLAKTDATDYNTRWVDPPTPASEANVKAFADADQNVKIATGDIGDGVVTTPKIPDEAVTESKLSSGVQTKLNATVEPTAVKPFAASGGRNIQGGDLDDETVTEGKLSGAVQTKLNATGGGSDADAIVSVTVEGDGPTAAIVSSTRNDASVNRASFRSVSAGGTEGQVFTKGQGNLFGWEDPPVEPWAQPNNNTQIPDAKISNTFARESVVEEQLALLDLAIQANVLPRQLRQFGGNLEYIPHPEGVWGQRADSTVGMNIGGGFLFSNDRTTTKGIPNEVGATTSMYSVANLPAAPNPNFVREHTDPNEDTNPFLGVTPYCNGPVIVTTPANQRRKVFTGIWGQQLGSRPTETALDIDNTMFSIGDKGLIRWNAAGIEVRTGADSAINRVVTQYNRIGSQNLTDLGNNNYTPAALASSFTGASQTFRLVADVYDADESVPIESAQVDIEANASSKNFVITFADRIALRGTIQYNGSTRVLTIDPTSGNTLPGSHIILNVLVRSTFTYTRPSRTVYEALVLSDDVVRPGVDFIFGQNNKNVFVFAFEKQFDEDDAGNNIMKLVFRINGITREINLHQTYDELGLGGTEFRVGSRRQYVSHIQSATSTEDLGTADLLALDVEQIGWGQLQQNHRDNDYSLNARFAANQFRLRNADGTSEPFNPAAPWAQQGNAQKIPADKLNLSATNPSGILNPIVVDITHFDGTTDVDLGRPVDGANGLRSQYESVRVIASYGKGGSRGEAERVSLTFKPIEIFIDALPANNPAGWERFVTFDSYDGTLEKVGIRVFQPASTNGDANLHFHLYYQNHDPAQRFRAIIPGGIGRFANLRIAQFHDFGGQAYIMPRSAKGEKGDDGIGIKGDDGAPGSDAQVKPFAQLGSSTQVANGDIANGTIKAEKLNLDVTRRINPEPANQPGRFVRVNQQGTGYEHVAAPSGGLDQNAVDARVQAGVKDFAETGNSAKIDAGDTNFDTRLLPASPANGQIAQWNGTAWVAINTPSGGGGLDQNAVDARVRAGVKDFAETDSSTKIVAGDTDFDTRLLPASATTGQYVQWNGTAWVAVAAPSGGGGGGTVSGVSGWGTNLITSGGPIVTARLGRSTPSIITASQRTIDLSGEVDSILVVVTSSDGLHRNSVEIVAPMTPAESHQVTIETTAAGGGFNFTHADFSFPITTGANAIIQLDRQGSTNPRIIAVYKRTRGSVTPSTGGGGITEAQADARYSKIPVVNDNYLHLGNADLDTQGGVVSTGTGEQRGQRITGTTQVRVGEAAVRFLASATTNNLPTGTVYNETNGTIVLPAGHWILCAAVNLHNPTAAGNTNNHRQYACLSIDYDNNERHCNSVYMRNRDADVVNIAGKISVTGAVITDGSKFTTIRVIVDGDGSSLPGDIVIYSAHVHAYRQII